MAKIVTSIAVAKLISCLLEITTKHIINPTINKTIPRKLFTQKKIIKKALMRSLPSMMPLETGYGQLAFRSYLKYFTECSYHILD